MSRDALKNLSPERIKAFLASRNRAVLDDPGLKRAGVLMVLFPKNGELHVLLTKRTSDVEHHKGQISFPGGAVDDSDKDIIGTALREAEEEIGLGADQVEVLGIFDDAWVPSGFAITPVIGYARSLPALSPNLDEVEQTIEVPLSFFRDSANERVKQVERNGKRMNVYFYTYGAFEIWGATAGMLRSFLRAVEG